MYEQQHGNTGTQQVAAIKRRVTPPRFPTFAGSLIRSSSVCTCLSVCAAVCMPLHVYVSVCACVCVWGGGGSTLNDRSFIHSEVVNQLTASDSPHRSAHTCSAHTMPCRPQRLVRVPHHCEQYDDCGVSTDHHHTQACSWPFSCSTAQPSRFPGVLHARVVRV